MNRKHCLCGLFAAAALVGCGAEQKTETAPAATGVDHARIVAADAAEWLSHGRDYAEQRFSPLDTVSSDNVGELGLAWYFDVPTKRGMEATPIIVDGRMFVTGSWSIVYALDAATGELLWRFHTVPGNPAEGFENDTLEAAAKVPAQTPSVPLPSKMLTSSPP